MLQNFLLILIGVYSQVHTKTIMFHVDEIQCNNVFHPYNKYYGSPCTRWKNSMSTYFNYVTCTAVIESTSDDLIAVCSPTLGDTQDPIKVEYQLKKKCADFDDTCGLFDFKEQYKLEANVSLNNPLHPTILLSYVTIMLGVFLYSWRHYGFLPKCLATFIIDRLSI